MGGDGTASGVAVEVALPKSVLKQLSYVLAIVATWCRILWFF